jgi:hypothetical protein
VAQIWGFRVQNYRSLRDVTLGKLSGNQETDILTPLTLLPAPFFPITTASSAFGDIMQLTMPNRARDEND